MLSKTGDPASLLNKPHEQMKGKFQSVEIRRCGALDCLKRRPQATDFKKGGK